MRERVWGEEAYNLALENICDYKTWEDFGGAKIPPPALNGHDPYVWFVPDWLNVWGGGHYTLFRFANHFAKRSGAQQIIYVFNNQRHAKPDILQAELDNAFPDKMFRVVLHAAEIPACEAVFATTWQSAYAVRAFPFARHKFYFMQDYESQFYPYGTLAMQANNTYSFGFTGITGGSWLKRMYEKHGGKAENYIFATDQSIFYPAKGAGQVRPVVSRLFFYGRPSTERRCFELGLGALKKIAEKYPDVEIVIAGLNLSAPPPFKATLLGNLGLKATGDLYRACDIGIAFSGTNLSYLPLELMASGVPVISNSGEQVEWFCEHKTNAYLVDPTPQAILEAFELLYNDANLRQKLVDGGLEKTSRVTWESEMDRIYHYVQSSLVPH